MSRAPLRAARPRACATRRGLVRGSAAALAAAASGSPSPPSASAAAPAKRPRTNETVAVVEGVRQRRLGSGGVVVSELGLGTQRWGSADFNAPDEALCHEFLNRAVLEHGVSLVDTAEQYPIPSDFARPEGRTEEIIGSWLAQDRSRRDKLVVATKITGGANVTAANIVEDCEGSLRRLGTDYLDVYTLHWPARYTPQSNWGQSLMYHPETERDPYYASHASFEEIASAMGKLVEQGKIRGYGMCNDNAFGLTATCYAARALGVPGPCTMQNDFSLIDRRAEENGVSEASSPAHENVGFMAYNALAGGVLTGKYMDRPAAVDDPNPVRAQVTSMRPRGRMDEGGWGRTLYRYRSGPALEAAREYKRLADRFGLSLAEMSLRWCRERTGVTTTLVGHTSMEQLEESLKAFSAEERLPEELTWEIDRVHMRNRLPIFASDDVPAGRPYRGSIGERIP